MAEEKVTDPRTGIPGVVLCCTGGVLVYFFGTYWLNNPDVNIVNGQSSLCAANSKGEIKIMS